MKDEDNGSGWPNRRDTLIFWVAILTSVLVTSVGGLELLRVMGWVQ